MAGVSEKKPVTQNSLSVYFKAKSSTSLTEKGNRIVLNPATTKGLTDARFGNMEPFQATKTKKKAPQKNLAQ